MHNSCLYIKKKCDLNLNNILYPIIETQLSKKNARTRVISDAY